MMKKFALILAIPALLVACGGEEDKKDGKDAEKKSEKAKFDPNVAADDYCACADLAGQEQTDCHQDWADKYKAPMTDGTASRAQGEQLGKKMAECDPGNAMKVLQMLM